MFIKNCLYSFLELFIPVYELLMRNLLLHFQIVDIKIKIVLNFQLQK